MLLAELAVQAGFPRGVVNVVTGYGDPTGSALVSHPGVDRIAFTGSTATGRKIATVAAERNARVSLELGGKSPNVIFADADLSNAVNGVMAGVFAATGQSCMAGSRVLVQSSVFDQVAELLAARGRKMRAGDPLDPATQLGPLASRPQLEKVLGYLELGKREGLPLLTGGARMETAHFQRHGADSDRALGKDGLDFAAHHHADQFRAREVFGVAGGDGLAVSQDSDPI